MRKFLTYPFKNKILTFVGYIAWSNYKELYYLTFL